MPWLLIVLWMHQHKHKLQIILIFWSYDLNRLTRWAIFLPSLPFFPPFLILFPLICLLQPEKLARAAKLPRNALIEKFKTPITVTSRNSHQENNSTNGFDEADSDSIYRLPSPDEVTEALAQEYPASFIPIDVSSFQRMSSFRRSLIHVSLLFLSNVIYLEVSWGLLFGLHFEGWERKGSLFSLTEPEVYCLLWEPLEANTMWK